MHCVYFSYTSIVKNTIQYEVLRYIKAWVEISPHAPRISRVRRINYGLECTQVLPPEPVEANCKDWLSIYRVLEEHTMCCSSLYLIVLRASVQRVDSAHEYKRWPYGYLSVSRQRMLQTTGQLISEGMNLFCSSSRFSIDILNWPLADLLFLSE